MVILESGRIGSNAFNYVPNPQPKHMMLETIIYG